VCPAKGKKKAAGTHRSFP